METKERARVEGELRLQEVGGQRVGYGDCAREGGNEQRNERKEEENGWRVYERACSAVFFFFNPAPRFFQFHRTQLSAEDFRGFCSRPETEGETIR